LVVRYLERQNSGKPQHGKHRTRVKYHKALLKIGMAWVRHHLSNWQKCLVLISTSCDKQK
jgi:hypothetical protein